MENINELRTSQDHIRLADSIKSVHATLREKIREGQSFEEVWSEHLKDESLLESYSSSMNTLATKHWTKLENEDADTSRILWTRAKIQDYFSGSGLTKQLQRDANRLKRQISYREEQNDNVVDMPVLQDPNNDYRNSKICEKIKVLDVGSCYNPFSKFSELEVTAIDIAPVYQNNVYKSDFLKLNVSEKSELKEGEVISLKCACYDVVIFCFLLEYLPQTKPRYDCCLKAYHLLKQNGVLIILTPDSCHQQRNNLIIKGWKEALLQMGFQQVYYEKKQHFHGLVVRKLSEEQHKFALLEAGLHTETTVENISTKFVIPQDSNTREASIQRSLPDNNTITHSHTSKQDSESSKLDFMQLPQL